MIGVQIAPAGTWTSDLGSNKNSLATSLAKFGFGGDTQYSMYRLTIYGAAKT
jgi:hypothetical protein